MKADPGRAGQFRIIEAATAAIIIFVTIAAVNQFTRNPRLIMTGRSANLRSMAYNVLYRLADTSVLENTVGKGSRDWESDLKIVLDTLLPSTVYFNLTVYALQSPAEPLTFVVHNRKQISNCRSPDAFKQTPEISSATFLYVAHDSKMYVLRLQLAEGGVGE
ncbi:MAG: hypothetical protein JTT11_02855 [Candidatus Brockarchaeota archaeon]|nr:hypothetical protein [Candidatus Brockarchaeota archaeon]